MAGPCGVGEPSVPLAGAKRRPAGQGRGNLAGKRAPSVEQVGGAFEALACDAERGEVVAVARDGAESVVARGAKGELAPAPAGALPAGRAVGMAAQGGRVECRHRALLVLLLLVKRHKLRAAGALLFFLVTAGFMAKVINDQQRGADLLERLKSTGPILRTQAEAEIAVSLDRNNELALKQLG